MPDKRLNPETLLQRAQEEEQQEKRGKLKIYLGAAPGVGKTYTMLQNALALRKQDLDVIIGVVESHGRQEINALIQEFENLPRKEIEYRDKKLYEFDLDEALKRAPALILIDEMAHTNASGMRHTKRWRDIKELLERGIDVYTTLNVQHIESLNDDVSQIIHAPVKETVPDTMLEMADTIELVDLPPEDLLKRLHEGKIYFPEQAALAAEHFFLKGNLIALRELALRITAERVGEQVLLYRQNKGIKYIWPTKEKILVCVGAGPESLKLIRAARRMANSLQVKWMAIYVDVPKLQPEDDTYHLAVQNLQFAERLGAETRVLTGFSITDEIMRFAREQNVTQIMVWKHIHAWWRDLFIRSLADDILRHSGEIDVYIMTGPEQANQPLPYILPKTKISWRTYAIATLIITVSTSINLLLYPFAQTSDFMVIYILGIALVALYGRIGPSIFTIFVSLLIYDFVFLPPAYSLFIDKKLYAFTIIIMLAISLVINLIILLLKRQIETSRFAEHQTAALHTLSSHLANIRGIDNVLNVSTQYIADLFDNQALILIPVKHDLVVRASTSMIRPLTTKEQSVAQWVFEVGHIAGLGTDTLPFANALYIPLITSHNTIGVLRVSPKKNQLFSPEQINLLTHSAHQIALALEAEIKEPI